MSGGSSPRACDHLRRKPGSPRHHGYLGSVEEMVDLTSVPAEHLGSLASSVTECVHIENIKVYGLVTILGSVKSKVLNIYSQSLSSGAGLGDRCGEAGVG